MIQWKAEKRNVADLKDLSNNPRKIKGEAFEKLKARIIERGFHDILKVDTEGYVLSGNQRKRALTDLGITEVTVLVPDRPLDPKERDAIILESNRNDGDWDYDMLANEFDIDLLKDVGFSDSDLGLVSFKANPKDTPSCAELREMWRQGQIGPKSE